MNGLQIKIGLFIAVLSFGGYSGTAQEKPTFEGLNERPTAEQILRWINDLESESYAARHMAFQLIETHPDLAIKPVEEAIGRVDEDAAHRLIRLLGGWGSFPEDELGAKAFAILKRLGRGAASTRSAFAQSVVESIRESQNTKAQEFLRVRSAFVDWGQIQLFASGRSPIEPDTYLLKIDDSFRGNADDLDCLKWLNSVEVVRLEGERIDRKWLEKVVALPSLRILQVRHTALTGADIALLHGVEHLEGLEILYSPVDDAAVESLAGLPLAGRLRLFGTNMSEAGIEELRNQMQGSEIMFGKGGFLGIGADDTTLVLSQITPGSAAEKAGLQIQDRIIKIEDIVLQNFRHLRAELAKYPPGAEVTLTAARVEYYRVDEPNQLQEGELQPQQIFKPRFAGRWREFELKVVLGEQP